MQRGSGLAVFPDGGFVADTNVVITAPLPIGYIDVACRIVAVIDEEDRFGFAYGTLSVQSRAGRGSLTRRADGARCGDVLVEAVSRSAYRLGRLGPFVTDRLQNQANNRYLHAMERAVAD